MPSSEQSINDDNPEKAKGYKSLTSPGPGRDLSGRPQADGCHRCDKRTHRLHAASRQVSMLHDKLAWKKAWHSFICVGCWLGNSLLCKQAGKQARNH